MIKQTQGIKLKSILFREDDLKKGTWITLLHARRIPPHVGLIIDGNYNSLTIKGQELNVSIEVLLKLISQRNIEAFFIRLVEHPVYSTDYQLRIFQETIKQFDSVKTSLTCLHPVKLFFREFYALQLHENELLFDFLFRLNANNFIEAFSTQNFSSEILEIPFYTKEKLQSKIEQSRREIIN